MVVDGAAEHDGYSNERSSRDKEEQEVRDDREDSHAEPSVYVAGQWVVLGIFEEPEEEDVAVHKEVAHLTNFEGAHEAVHYAETSDDHPP